MTMIKEKAYEKEYADKKRFVETLSEAFSPLRDFDEIQYAREFNTGGEYLKVSDTIGGCLFINVTGNSKETILKEVCKIALEKRPEGYITDITVKRQIAPLFR